MAHLRQTGTPIIQVGRQYRALALREADTVKWFWVGPHDEYMKLLNRL